tara:strand:- start:1673 stop:1966 length:294 start_codon:yes stop_codon:yes gene_type:complete
MAENNPNIKLKVYVGDNAKTNATTCSMEQIRSFVKTIKAYEQEITDVREKIKQTTNDFVDEYGLPKKEVKVAIRMLKGDIDPEMVSAIYVNIADLIE